MKRGYCPVHDVHDDPDVDREWYVYSCFAADGTPLYVGMAEDVERRLYWHAKYSGSGLWYYHCTRVEASAPFKCRYDAHATEVAEIERLRPAFNKHHNPAPTSLAEARDVLPAALGRDPTGRPISLAHPAPNSDEPPSLARKTARSRSQHLTE